MQEGLISIVIPTNGSLSWRNGSFKLTVQSITHQLHENIEIITMASEPEEDFVAYCDDLNIICHGTEAHSIAQKRNEGARLASGDYLVFLDDDTVIVDRLTISSIVDTLKEFHFCCGANRYWSTISWYKYLIESQSFTSKVNTLKDISFLPKGINRIVGYRDLNEFTFIGNFGGIRRNVFFDVGMFNMKYEGWGLEDTDLMMKLCLNNYTHLLLKDKGISVIHLSHTCLNENDFCKNLGKFDKIQKRRGHYFHTNHFFGVYEADGYSLFTPVQ